MGGVNVLNVILGVKRDFRELKESKSFWKLKGDCERVKSKRSMILESKRRFLDVMIGCYDFEGKEGF